MLVLSYTKLPPALANSKPNYHKSRKRNALSFSLSSLRIHKYSGFLIKYRPKTTFEAVNWTNIDFKFLDFAIRAKLHSGNESTK